MSATGVGTACTVRLPIFEGPLDLLLHLIKRNEVQVADIPIATITEQYLEMLEALPELSLDGAGEYLVMAATLIYIKSRMLLPTTDDEEAEEDPRAELVQQLVEYQRFREAAAALGERNVLDRDVFAGRGEPIEPGADPEAGPPVRDASLGDLLDALRDILGRLRPPRAHEVTPESLTVHACVQRILGCFVLADEVDFTDLFGPETHRVEVIVTFLALLELIRMRVLRARQPDRFGPIRLALTVASVEEAALRVRELGDIDEWSGGEGSNGHGTAVHR
jgi:segregation and condensation protein A